MLNRIMREAPREAVLRVARAQPDEWSDYLYHFGSGRRDFVGHLEDWRYGKTFEIEPQQPFLTARQHVRARHRFSRLCARLGPMKAILAIRAAAKRSLGRKGLEISAIAQQAQSS